MEQFLKWIRTVQRTENVPDTVSRAVQDTLGSLPDRPQKRNGGAVWKWGSVVAAVLVLVCGGILVVNPSLAANLPILEKIFLKVEKTAVYSGTYNEAKKIQSENTAGLNAESQGVKIAASEVYCDGFSVYVTMEMQSDQYDLSKEENSICMKTQYGFENTISKEDSDIILDGKSVGKHTFIGMMKFDETDVTKKDGTLGIRILEIYLYNGEQNISGEWNFEIPYTVSEKGVQKVEINEKVNNHLTIKNLFISPYQIVLFTKEKSNVSNQIALFDQDGKRILFEEIGNGSGKWERKLYATGGREITKIYGYVAMTNDFTLYLAKTKKEAKRLSTYQFCVEIEGVQ